MGNLAEVRPGGVTENLVLACHPATPSSAVMHLAASVARQPDGSLAVSYRVSGDLDRLRLPAPAQPARRDRLWEHTCCEIFLAAKGEAGYREFNFSPSGEWAAYAFRTYRERDGAADPSDAPRITWLRQAGAIELAVRIDGRALPEGRAVFRIGLCAVVEEISGAHSYWALRHPAARPDFHHRDGFALTLPPPTMQ